MSPSLTSSGTKVGAEYANAGISEGGGGEVRYGGQGGREYEYERRGSDYNAKLNVGGIGSVPDGYASNRHADRRLPDGSPHGMQRRTGDRFPGLELMGLPDSEGSEPGELTGKNADSWMAEGMHEELLLLEGGDLTWPSCR